MKKLVVLLVLILSSNPALAKTGFTVEHMVRQEAAALGIPPALAVAVAKSESNFRCSAVGRHGERGVMQIKPRTARSLGYKGPDSGLNNCKIGVYYGLLYLRSAYMMSKGNWYRTALLYNAGLGTKRKKSLYAQKIVQKAIGRRNHR